VGYDLISVDVEKPVVPALVFGKTLLLAEAGPGITDDPRAFPLRDGDCGIAAATVDDDDLIYPVNNRSDAATDPVRLIPRDNETRYG
jgi:hypothetical protein